MSSKSNMKTIKHFQSITISKSKTTSLCCDILKLNINTKTDNSCYGSALIQVKQHKQKRSLKTTVSITIKYLRK